MKNTIIALSTLLLSLNVLAFGLPKAEVASINKDTQNMVAALQVIQDGGIKCSTITDFKVAPNVKGYQVECDSNKKYTLLDTEDGLVLQVK
ncbi:hypothetical protein [Vibrio ishigakensis]|uniref:hypothetical protein n=1 Tax=Vibrio ishigakensis TaxID=1481914 RepID=UPI0021C2D198|nr:hypothetical protein [Vibrio ishigakensis]